MQVSNQLKGKCLCRKGVPLENCLQLTVYVCGPITEGRALRGCAPEAPSLLCAEMTELAAGKKKNPTAAYCPESLTTKHQRVSIKEESSQRELGDRGFKANCCCLLVLMNAWPRNKETNKQTNIFLTSRKSRT